MASARLQYRFRFRLSDDCRFTLQRETHGLSHAGGRSGGIPLAHIPENLFGVLNDGVGSVFFDKLLIHALLRLQ